MRKSIPVSEVMSRPPVVVNLKTSIEEIHNLFEENSFHHLPVMDRGLVKGIISKADYMRVRHMLSCHWPGISDSSDTFKKVHASDIMSSPALLIEASDTVGLAADIFLANKLHALPVVDDGELVGIVTSHDLLSYAYDEL